MRIKISYKVFTVNIGIIALLTVAFIYSFSELSHSMFGGAVNGIDVEVMKHLSKKLSVHYKEQRSWDAFLNDKKAWNDTATQSFFHVFFELVEKAKKRMDEEKKVDITPPKDQNNSGGEWNFPFGTFMQRLSLLDEKKNYLIKAEILKDDLNYQPIKLDGKIIGWLNVGKIKFDVTPLSEYFLKQQLEIVYWVVLIGGIMISIISFLFSRLITAPIHKLIQGADEIAGHNYQHRLSIKTNDELEQLADRFNFLAHKLSRYETQKKQWLVDISHELRTPLSILISETSAICDNLSPCDISAVGIIRDDLVQMKRLVDDLHDLSKIDEVGFSFHKERVCLAELVDSQLEHYEKRFLQRSITLHRDITTEPAVIQGDHDRLIQVVRILLENAFRYMNSPGELWVRCLPDQKNIVFIVEDSGPGVPEESLGKLFDRLYRIDTSRNRSIGGVGLGLAICKEILNAHNAKVTASHSAKGGLCITATFQRHEDEL